MALIRRAVSLIRRIRSPPQFAAARNFRPNDSSTSFLTVFVGFTIDTAFADNAAEAELVPANDQGEAYVTGLRRIEDGSVVSNSHTIKWRLFTDKGRDLFLKGKLDEAEMFFQSAIDEAKEGFGPRDPHVASSYNNLIEGRILGYGHIDYANTMYLLGRGWDSLDTVTAAEGLALILQSLGSLKEAQDLLERCLEARKKILPHDHIQVAANMLHLGRVAMHKSNQLRKVNISETKDELEKAKLHVDNAIRISKAVLDCVTKNQNSLQSKSVSNGSVKDQHMALLILEINFVLDVELALWDCISMFKEPRIRILLDAPDVKSEYLSCLRHLKNLVSENIDGNTEKSRELKELRDEALHVEAELSPTRRRKN